MFVWLLFPMIFKQKNKTENRAESRQTNGKPQSTTIAKEQVFFGPSAITDVHFDSTSKTKTAAGSDVSIPMVAIIVPKKKYVQ